MASLSPAEMQSHLAEWKAWMGGLAASRRLKGGQPLGKPAACVRPDLVVDGPYMEAKDVVGGYVIASCNSMHHAIETAKACPGVALGSVVEVRQLVPNILE